MSTAQALALPDNKQVYGVSSAEALARSVAAELDAVDVVIVGDARRQFLWYAKLEGDSQCLSRPVLHSLIRPNELPSLLDADTVVATPDWDRLCEMLTELVPDKAKLVKEQRVPNAERVGQIAYAGISKKIPGPALAPIYLHPPIRGAK